MFLMTAKAGLNLKLKIPALKGRAKGRTKFPLINIFLLL
jgi:hypothetical protein